LCPRAPRGRAKRTPTGRGAGAAMGQRREAHRDALMRPRRRAACPRASPWPRRCVRRPSPRRAASASPSSSPGIQAFRWPCRRSRSPPPSGPGVDPRRADRLSDPLGELLGAAPVGDGQDEHQLVAAMSGPVTASVEARRSRTRSRDNPPWQGRAPDRNLVHWARGSGQRVRQSPDAGSWRYCQHVARDGRGWMSDSNLRRGR
jgi:hypothetical protein